jgi:hypothetical protein
MKHGLVVVLIGFGLVACSPDVDTPEIVSSARAASPVEPLYPPLAADAVDGTVLNYE